MEDYEHHIFLSYRRSDEDWIRWTRDNFMRALGSLLRPRIGKVNIFIDDAIETGASWPQHLASKLSRSKLLVSVLSRDYFQSDWCRLELALMHHRERLISAKTTTGPLNLIIPIVIDDGDCFPAEVQAMQCQSMHQFANPFIRIDSPKQEAIADLLKDRVCPAIERALARVPQFDPEWENIAHAQFENMYKIHVQSQTTLPSLVLPKLPKIP